MAMTFDIKFDEAQMKRLQDEFRSVKQKLPGVLVKAVNKTVDWSERRIVDAIYRQLKLTRGQIRNPSSQPGTGITKRKASVKLGLVGGRVSISSKPIRLDKFGAKALKPSLRRRRFASGKTIKQRYAGPVSYKVSRRGGRKKSRDIFFATVKKNKDGSLRTDGGLRSVFSRRPNGKLWLVKGPSLPFAFETNKELKGKIERDILAVLSIEIDRAARATKLGVFG